MSEPRVDVEIAVQAEQIANIEEKVDRIDSGVAEIKGDIKTVLPIVAVHAEKIGKLENRMERVEGQLNWGKWLGGIAAAAATVAGVVVSRGGI